MKRGDGNVYIPMDLMKEITQIPVVNEGRDDEYWEGRILMNYAYLVQSGQSPTPEEIGKLQNNTPVEIIGQVLEKYRELGWLERLDVTDEDLAAANDIR